MGEAVGHHPALRFALKRVIADGLGGAHSFLEIAGLHYRLSLRVLGIGGPNAGIAVGLKLDLHLDRIAFVLASAGLQLLRLAQCAQNVLDVMANLVCDDIGHGEVARRLEALRQLAEEFRVEVDVGVGRTIEGPHRRLRRTAARLVGFRIEMEVGRRVTLPLRLKQRGPGVLGACEHLQREMADLRVQVALARRGADLLLLRSHAAAGATAETAERAQQEVADDENNDAADTEAAGDERQEAA